MHTPKVSIIVLNWNSLADTRECLESLQQTTYQPYEVIVVDNGSTDNSPTLLKQQFPGITLLQNRTNLGFSAGNNIGIRHALENGAQYVWLLNNDTIVSPDTIATLIAAAEDDQSCGLLNPVIYYRAEPSQVQFCGAVFDDQNYTAKLFKTIAEARAYTGNDICLWGTALLIHHKVIERIGFLNEDFFMYGEDDEYCLRARATGFRKKVVFAAHILHTHHYLKPNQPPRFPLYSFFYRARNGYWLWKQHLPRGHASLTFFRRYLATMLRRAGCSKDTGNHAAASATLEGLYAALTNQRGKWDQRPRIPVSLKQILLWHPYLLADLAELKLGKIAAGLWRQMIKRKLSLCQP